MPDRIAQTVGDARAFLEAVDHPGRREDALILCDLMERLSGWPPRLWGTSMVGFGHYHYRYDSGHEGESFRVGFSPRRANMVVYIMPGYYDFTDQLARLGPHKMGKSCLYLGRLNKIDLDVLSEMITLGLKRLEDQYPTTK